MQKILIIQTAFLGDVVLATVIVERIFASVPNVQIDFLLRKGNEGVLKDHPLINQTIIWDKKQHKLKTLIALIKKIRREKYNKVINVQRFFTTGILTILAGAEETTGFDKNPLSVFFNIKVKHIIALKAKDYIHEVDRNLRLVEHFTQQAAAEIKLYPSPENWQETAQYKFKKYICIAPSSVWFTKQYPVEKWASFLKKVPADIGIYLLGGGAADNTICEKIITLCPGITIKNLCGKLSILASAALMKDAIMNYVNDSAPLHLASAMNAPVTAIFCSTIPMFGYGPLSDHYTVVEALASPSCRPCGLHGKTSCPKHHFDCAFRIEDDQLLNSLSML